MQGRIRLGHFLYLGWAYGAAAYERYKMKYRSRRLSDYFPLLKHEISNSPPRSLDLLFYDDYLAEILPAGATARHARRRCTIAPSGLKRPMLRPRRRAFFLLPRLGNSPSQQYRRAQYRWRPCQRDWDDKSLLKLAAGKSSPAPADTLPVSFQAMIVTGMKYHDLTSAW